MIREFLTSFLFLASILSLIPTACSDGAPDGSGGATNTRCDQGVASGGDACSDNWGNTGFSVDPPHLRTGVDEEPTIVLSGTSAYTIPDEVLDALKSASLISLASNAPVEADTTWGEELTWDGHQISLRIDPGAPLDEGWYAVDIESNLNTGHGTPKQFPQVEKYRSQSAFRVGSAPVLLSIERCDERITLGFSETVVAPDPVPVSAKTGDGVHACFPDPVGGGSSGPRLVLKCPGVFTADAAEVVIEPGIVSPSSVPLRDAAGNETITHQFGSATRCVVWEEVVVPTF